MTDPVSEELERRAHLDIGWRWAAIGAAAIHLAAASVLFLAPTHGRRVLSLPHIQVRIAAALAVGGGRPAAERPAAPPKPAPEAHPVPSKSKPAEQAPPKHAIPDKRAPRRAAPPSRPPSPSAAEQSGQGTGAGSGMTSASGGIALGSSAAGEEPFPFTYYLNRVLAVIESNWFRPPAPAGTLCRVRCVIDRTGHLAEAGLEAESQIPAFDRAALRAVYASAPFPPLPQGFGGSTLTLHLEFGS